MKRLAAALCALTISAPSCIYAQTTDYVAIPAIAFDGRSVSYNSSGTAAFIRDRAFAPVYLPDGARLVGFRCGAKVWPVKGLRIILRRNHPQQANVDLDTVGIPKGGDGNFKFLKTAEISHPVVDNARYNYYFVVEPIERSPNTASICNGQECLIAACQVEYHPPK